jgi:MFS family permease
VINDGYIASLSLLLPFIVADLGLSYTQSGLLKTVSHGAMSAAQLPAGFLAERLGEILLLGSGTAFFGLSYAGLLFVVSYPMALAAVFFAGAGGGAYHPVGTGLVADAFPAEGGLRGGHRHAQLLWRCGQGLVSRLNWVFARGGRVARQLRSIGWHRCGGGFVVFAGLSPSDRLARAAEERTEKGADYR